MAASIYLLVQSSVSKKKSSGSPGFEDFGLSINVAHFRSAEIVIWSYLFIYYPVETFKFLQTCISGLSKLIFKLLRGRVGGENCHLHLRSTTSGPHFVPTILIPLRYDAMNELKMRICNPAISVWRSNHLSIGLQLRADFSMLYIHSTDPTAGNSDNTFQFYSKKKPSIKKLIFRSTNWNWKLANGKTTNFLGSCELCCRTIVCTFQRHWFFHEGNLILGVQLQSSLANFVLLYRKALPVRNRLFFVVVFFLSFHEGSSIAS